MLDTMYQWCVIAFSSGLWYIPTPIDQVLDRCVGTDDTRQDRCTVWAAVLHPGKKFRHMLHLPFHQAPLRTVCLQQDSDHMCLWPDYHSHHNTAKHGYSGVVKESNGEWNVAMLSSVMRGSVCMQVMH